MKAIQIAELKNGLSKFLKRVSKGERFVVTDRAKPVAELIPIQEATRSKQERLIEAGMILPARRSFGSVKISPLSSEIDVQALLQEVRDE